LQLDDFQKFKAVGCNAKPISKSDKGHAGELAAFHRAVRGEIAWPIPLAQQLQAMTVAFEVEKRLQPNAFQAPARPLESSL